MSAQIANTNIASLNEKMAQLIEAFDAHPQMQPPNPHPTIFFLKDFVKNTHEQLKQIDADKFAAGDKGASDAVQEVVGRNQFASLLLNDSSGKLSLMTGSDPSNPVDFGPDVKAKARALAEA